MRAWTFQDARQKAKLGNKAPWSVGWLDPDTGKRRSKKIGSKTAAERYARRLEGQVEAGTYTGDDRRTWDDFIEDYRARIAEGLKASTREITMRAIGHFERICNPRQMRAIDTEMIDRFIATRRKEPVRPCRKKNRIDKNGNVVTAPGRGVPKGNLVSVATVNKELRHIRAVLQIAQDWGCLLRVPKFRMIKEPKRKVTYVTPDDFGRIYTACKVAKRPAEPGQEYSAAEWWRALTMFAYLTGWRIGEILALTWDDVSLDNATALTLAEDNKSERDDEVPLHPLVVDHLRKVISFDTPGNHVFYWPHHERTLWTDFATIQESAGIHLNCRRKHEHGPGCFRYSFHDFRRGFATQNALKLGGDALQALMRHESYETTKKYIEMAENLKGITVKYFTPQLPETDDET